MKNVSFELKQMKLWNEQHFVENKIEIMQYVSKMQQISVLLKYIKLISRDVFPCVNASL
jgi:hypothetical protein